MAWSGDAELMALEGCEHENRPSIRELHPDLRARIMALDEPVPRQSWLDVVQRWQSRLIWSRHVPAVAYRGKERV
jgi:hypothetical protein